MRPALVALPALLALGLLTTFSWRRVAQDRYASLEAEGIALLRLLGSAAEEASLRLAEAEDRHALHLTAIARRASEALSHRRAPAALTLAEIARDAGTERLYLLGEDYRVSATGHRRFALSPQTNGMLSTHATTLAEHRDVSRAVARLKPGRGQVVIEGVRRNAFGTQQRFGVALGRADGSTLLVRTNADALARLRYRLGIDALLARVREQEGVASVQILQDGGGERDPIPLGQHQIHVRMPLKIEGRPQATLEIALDTRSADRAVSRTRTQIAIWSGIAVLLLVGALAWISRVERRNARRERRLRESAEDDRRLADMGALSGLMAHELRNPLNTIGMALALLPPSESDSPIGRPLHAIHQETVRMTETLERFMALARSPSPRSQVVDSRVLRAVSARVQRAADDAGVRVVCRPGKGVIEANTLLIEQALTNIVRNAIEATPRDKTVHVEWRLDHTALRITVLDQGPGFQSHGDTLFRVGTPGRPDGHGLGLPLARRHVTAAGGRLRLADHPGGGAAVTIEFPARRDDHAD